MVCLLQQRPKTRARYLFISSDDSRHQVFFATLHTGNMGKLGQPILVHKSVYSLPYISLTSARHSWAPESKPLNSL